MYFFDADFSADQYDEATRQLEEAGAGAPEGQLHHVAIDLDGRIGIFDLWESQEAFEAFGATLMPILASLEVNPGTPTVAQVHNEIKG
jgi:hypothetical protein